MACCTPNGAVTSSRRIFEWELNGCEERMVASDYVHLDDRFGALVTGSASVEKLFTGCRWAEGPAYLPLARSVVWSDIPNDRMLRWDETTGAVGVYRNPAGYTNGHT